MIRALATASGSVVEWPLLALNRVSAGYRKRFCDRVAFANVERFEALRGEDGATC
jgi:hypothetical protein